MEPYLSSFVYHDVCSQTNVPLIIILLFSAVSNILSSTHQITETSIFRACIFKVKRKKFTADSLLKYSWYWLQIPYSACSRVFQCHVDKLILLRSCVKIPKFPAHNYHWVHSWAKFVERSIQYVSVYTWRHLFKTPEVNYPTDAQYHHRFKKTAYVTCTNVHFRPNMLTDFVINSFTLNSIIVLCSLWIHVKIWGSSTLAFLPNIS